MVKQTYKEKWASSAIYKNTYALSFQPVEQEFTRTHAYKVMFQEKQKFEAEIHILFYSNSML